MKLKYKSIMRLALPYVLIALLPILVVFFLSALLINNYTDEMLADQNNDITVAVGRIEEQITSIEQRTMMITQDYNVLQYIYNAIFGRGNDIHACMEIQKFLSHVPQGRNIAEIYFYDGIEHRIISSTTVHYEPAVYFDYLYHYQDRTPEEVLNELNKAHWSYQYEKTIEIKLNDVLTKVIEYKISVPLERNKNQSHIVVAIDVEELFREFLDVQLEGSEFYIYDSQGLLYSNGDKYLDLAEQKQPSKLSKVVTDAGDLYCAEFSLNDGLWKAKFFYPSLTNTGSGDTLISYLLLAVAIPVILCIFLCIYFTHKNRLVIMDILTALRPRRTGEESMEAEYLSYKMILSYADDMAEKVSAYETRLREAHASQKNTVLERLVRNAYRSAGEKQKAIESLNLTFTGDGYAALCVQFDDEGMAYMISQELSARDIIADLLQTHIGTAVEVFDNLSNEVVCILSADERFNEIAENIISLLNVHIKYRYGFDLHIGIGNPVEAIHRIHESYSQARAVIRYNERTGRSLNRFGRIDAMDDVMLYPLLTDEKISNYMTLGRAEDAKKVIMDIYKDYFDDQERILSLEAIDFIKYRITNTVLSVAERQGASVPADGQKLLTEKNISKYFTELNELVDHIVAQIASKKTSAQNVLAVKVHEYIQAHFADSSLTVKQVAAQFHFHENYVSNLYKEEYGENLSAAIEKIRIEKACDLLGMTDTRIGDVAEAVGYSSDSSFRRAFKKITGVSPVDYRNTH